MKEIFRDSIRLLFKATDERQSMQYGRLSFFVEEGAGELEISLSRCSREEAQIPVALFDSHGNVRIFKASEGFSGPGTETYRISSDRASAGCIAGAIPSGEWKLLLYKRRFFEDIDVEVVVRMSEESLAKPVPRSFSFMDEVRDDSPGWYRGELHVHSSESTGRTSVEQVLSAADRAGLDFVAITDHFTASHWEKIEECFRRYRVLPIASMEISGDLGHANVHGARKWINPLVDDNKELAGFLGLEERPSMSTIADEIHAQGGVFGINHPLSGLVGWRYAGFPMEKCDLFDLWATPDADATMEYPVLYDGYLSQGYRLVGVGSSDSHNPDQVDGPWTFGRIFTYIYADELSSHGITEALRRGRVYVAMGESKMDFSACYEGRTYRMGERIPYSGGRVEFSFEIWDNPSGNLFVKVSSELVDVQYFKAYAEEGRRIYRFGLEEEQIRFINGRFAFIRLEFFEDTVKARFWGMAWKDSRSMRLLSNPIWIDDVRRK